MIWTADNIAVMEERARQARDGQGYVVWIGPPLKPEIWEACLKNGTEQDQESDSQTLTGI